MCHTVHTLMQTVICGIQMLVRVFMTVILMIENIIRMILQTIYNFLSFMLQLFSLIPICVVFMLTSRLKCFMCGGGGPCPVNRGGACDCLMSAIAIVIVFFIFRSTGILDKIFYKIGYAKALSVTKFVPSAGLITDCSRVGGRRQGDLGEEKFEETEGEELLRMGEPEPEELEDHEEIIENEMLNYNETEKLDEKTVREGNTILEEKAGPDEKGEPEETGKPEKKGEPEEKGKSEKKEKSEKNGEPEEKGKSENKGEPEEKGKLEKGKPEKGEPEKAEHEEKGKVEEKEKAEEKGKLEEKEKSEKEKSKVFRKGAFKVNKGQHEANVLNSNLDTTVVYYLV